MDIHEMAAAMRDFVKAARSKHILDTRDAAHLPAGTKYVVTCGSKTEISIEMVDPETGKAMIQEGPDQKPVEGYLKGSFISEPAEIAPGDAWHPGKRLLLGGQIKKLALLEYEINGKGKFADGIYEVKIFHPAGFYYDLWATYDLEAT